MCRSSLAGIQALSGSDPGIAFFVFSCQIVGRTSLKYIYVFFAIICCHSSCAGATLSSILELFFIFAPTQSSNDENSPTVMLRVLARGLLKIKFKRTGSIFVCEPLFETTTKWSVSVMLRRISVAPVKTLHCNFFNNVLFSTGGYYDVGPVPPRFQCFD